MVAFLIWFILANCVGLSLLLAVVLGPHLVMLTVPIHLHALALYRLKLAGQGLVSLDPASLCRPLVRVP